MSLQLHWYLSCFRINFASQTLIEFLTASFIWTSFSFAYFMCSTQNQDYFSSSRQVGDLVSRGILWSLLLLRCWENVLDQMAWSRSFPCRCDIIWGTLYWINRLLTLNWIIPIPGSNTPGLKLDIRRSNYDNSCTSFIYFTSFCTLFEFLAHVTYQPIFGAFWSCWKIRQPRTWVYSAEVKCSGSFIRK